MTTPASAPALRLDGVRKSFRRETGESVLALDNISFSVGQGELAALVGPDGAGKTTLIRLLAGLMKADGGTVTALGIDAAKDSQGIQSRISYMPQQFGLYDDLTVQENLDLYSDLHGVTAEERRAKYIRLMEMTGLDPFQKRLAGRLSGGMKQKLGLACTLVRTPELLLLDEPTVGVDPLSRRELWEIIHQLVKKGMTVLLSSSYLGEAEACERVLVLNEGKKLAEGPLPRSAVWRRAAPSWSGRPKEQRRGISRPGSWVSPISSMRCRRAGRSGWSRSPTRDPAHARLPASRPSRRPPVWRTDSWCSSIGRKGKRPPGWRCASLKNPPKKAGPATSWSKCAISTGVLANLSPSIG